MLTKESTKESIQSTYETLCYNTVLTWTIIQGLRQEYNRLIKNGWEDTAKYLELNKVVQEYHKTALKNEANVKHMEAKYPELERPKLLLFPLEHGLFCY